MSIPPPDGPNPPFVVEEVTAPGPALAPDMTAPMEKWGNALDAGFQILPDLLLRYQSELKLSPTDLVVLMHLTMSWWVKGRLPFPKPATIARRMGISERTAQRSIEHLRKLRLLYKARRKDKEGQVRGAFDLSPLAARLQQIAATDPVAERRRTLKEEAVTESENLSLADL